MSLPTIAQGECRPFPWTLHLPAMFRMMDRRYVERFFDTGELRLSSFAQFSRHLDDERRDNEGKHVVFGRAPNHTVVAVTGHGEDAYVLCGSAARPSKDLLKAFGSDAAIQILDPVGFGIAVARYVPGLKGGMSGFCDYSGGHIETFLDEQHLRGVLDPTNPNGLNDIGALAMRTAGTAVFFKKSPRFAHQVEYRWLWFSEGALDATTTIHAPDARAFCRAWFPDSSADNGVS